MIPIKNIALMKDQVIDDDVDEEIKLEAADDTRVNIVIKCKNKHY